MLDGRDTVAEQTYDGERSNRYSRRKTKKVRRHKHKTLLHEK